MLRRGDAGQKQVGESASASGLGGLTRLDGQISLVSIRLRTLRHLEVLFILGVEARITRHLLGVICLDPSAGGFVNEPGLHGRDLSIALVEGYLG